MSQHTTNQAEYLEQAFDTFNKMSVQLESSYRDLEDQVGVLTHELAAARGERLTQLAEKERLADRLERLLELLPAGVLVINAKGIIRQKNPMAETLLEADLVGQSWSAIKEKHFRYGLSDTNDVQLKSGKYVTLSMRSLDSEPGQVVLIMDISDQHALKIKLDRQDRLTGMGEMAASLAHQIRTPLTTALLYASNLQNQVVTPIEQQHMSAKIISRLKQLEHMVNDMLRFTRGGEFVPASIDLQQLFVEFAQVIEPQLEQIRGQLCLPELDQVIEVQGDQGTLTGALLNLANNAIQSMDEGLVIKIEVIKLSDNNVTLLFKDNGPGISKEISKKIFAPFFTTKTDGTGLGLAVVYATIQAHKGEIRLINKKEQGAWFEISLPLVRVDNLMSSGSNSLDYSIDLHANAERI
ncbi:MAG: PAS domain-containing sensor histidine kinase [Gammaproteobacteria bacterium]|nr:PAS domain-containing sensor histidine kinase [Gammaproteobacteria bacterium]